MLPELHGFNVNPRVMAARLALAEKGIEHLYREVGLADLARLKQEDLYRQLANAMPTLIHADVALYELEAILRYVDEAFPGPGLQPASPPARALMTQMMAIMRDQLHPCAIDDIVGPLLIQPLIGRVASPGDLDGAAARLEAILALISAMSAQIVARPGRDWLLGPAPGLADLQLAPIVHLLMKTEVGATTLGASDLLSVWWSRVKERAWLDAILSSAEIG